MIAGHLIGVESADSSSDFSVQGNLIGLAADGTTAVATGTGIRIGAGTTGAQVGGVEDGAGNTVAALEAGIAVAGEGTRIEGNTVGLGRGRRSGTAQESGIAVEGTAERTTIGGDRPGAGNTISGNLFGSRAEGGQRRHGPRGQPDRHRPRRDKRAAQRHRHLDRRRGGARRRARRGPDRRHALGAAQRDLGQLRRRRERRVHQGRRGHRGQLHRGRRQRLDRARQRRRAHLGCDSFIVPALAADDGFLVGGTVPGAGNRIAHNDGDDFDFGDGVRAGHTSGGVMILGNEIFANGSDTRELGIDLFDEGVSANGSQSPDVQPPFPVLTNVDAVAAGTLVQGTIDYPIGHAVRIEFFSNPSCDDSGHGEGQTPLGALTITGSGGPAAFGARARRRARRPRRSPPPPPTSTATGPPSSRAVRFAAGPRPRTRRRTTRRPGPGREIRPRPGRAASCPAPPDRASRSIDPPPPIACEVPKVVGLTLAEAKKRLARAAAASARSRGRSAAPARASGSSSRSASREPGPSARGHADPADARVEAREDAPALTGTRQSERR